MKWIITTIVASWMVAEVLCGEGQSCKVSRKRDCARTINFAFTRDIKTVTVQHIALSGKEDAVAVCDWIQDAFSCDLAGGYSVNFTSPTTLLFKIDFEVTCPNGSFIIRNNGHGLISCSLETSELEPLEHEEQDATGCQESTEAEHDDKNRFRRSIPRKCPHNHSNKDTADNKLIVPVAVPVVVVLIIVTLAAAAAAVAFSIRRKRGRKKLTQDTPEVELSLTQEKEINEHI